MMNFWLIQPTYLLPYLLITKKIKLLVIASFLQGLLVPYQVDLRLPNLILSKSVRYFKIIYIILATLADNLTVFVVLFSSCGGRK